ncbi:hypothetical protein RHSIM_Rhsim03G0022500 [Rhododendron simsii]|uniref:AAA+ ATPase domain-containing protein n=1 Tax=Rhododendron simsii TaxID=118357 RepID=A0A834LSI8_RHOSS|nr:hypothetical protein RHSIM_Rhsim03G0022500 [Rhododendron simsii]
MAEALALTCLGIGYCLVAPIRRQFTYICCFNSNITKLETQLKKLETTRVGVQIGVDESLRNVRVVGPNVQAWLANAEQVTFEVMGIIQDMAKVKEGCLYGWCPNLKLRYSLSRKAVKKTAVVADLQAAGMIVFDIQAAGVQCTQLFASLETVTNRDLMEFESRRLNMEEIIEALKHDEINLIGVCGMGGVGKTTLVNEVAKRVKEDYYFDEVAMAVVGQQPNLTDVQACIADMLGLENLRDTVSPIERADLLRRRLLQDNKKVLVILDDIYAEFDLQAMGIPLEGADKNFKMLYTSRIQDLWYDQPTKKEISLELLSEDEAWQLFREKAGDSADAPDLQPIAKQIVNECGRLPLALVIIGTALSKKSWRDTKEMWEMMLDQLTCARSTRATDSLYSSLELSYERLEDEAAKRLFLLCCLFEEGEDIHIEDLARYGLGLSLFDGIHEMQKVRRRVFLIVDELKSCYLLLESEKEECVKVHGTVRKMGVSIASKFEWGLVSDGAVSQWPTTVTHKHYTAISVISKEIKELHVGLTYPNLEFLMLQCRELENLPPNIFEGMEKLRVLELNSFDGILTLQSLRNLTMLSLEGFRGVLDNTFLNGNLLNLEILNFRNSKIEELPEEIGELVNLRLLDLTNTEFLNRIPPGIISRLVHLEELHSMGSQFIGWEGEGKEEEGRNANLRELGLLSNLNTLEIHIRSDVLIPKVPIFRELKIYKVIIDGVNDSDDDISDEEIEDEEENLSKRCKRVLAVRSSIPIPSNRGGIDSLLRSSDYLFLEGKGCNDLVQALQLRDGVDGLQQLKLLRIKNCNTPECLADTMHPVHLTIAHARPIFPILKVLYLLGLPNLREICRVLVPAGSFGELTSIRVHNCGRLRNLFQLPIVGCLTQVKRLYISSCGMMEEVFWKEPQEDIHVATNRIVFPKLEVLKLVNLPSLMGFCRGIDQIDFPQLKKLCLKHVPQVNLLFHNNSNLSSNSERNNNVGFLSLFPQKVTFPGLENLKLEGCVSLRNTFHPYMVRDLENLREIIINDCSKMKAVIDKEEVEDRRRREAESTEKTMFPNLRILELHRLPELRRFCHYTCPLELPLLTLMAICDCPSMDSFSLGHVSIPNLSWNGISRNG